MRIAVIGGGIYGVFLALELKKAFPVHLDLFEKNSALMREATSNNQHRLHLGFHYARSKETIIQSAINYEHFLNHFKECVLVPQNNYYLIHESSLVDIKEYQSIFSSMDIPYENVDLRSISVKNHDHFTGCMRVKEGIIYSNLIRDKLNGEIKKSGINVHLNTFVESISNNEIFFKNRDSESYDIVINATYYNSCMGLKNPVKFKYELCCLLLFQNIKPKDMGITIVDGNYVSLYPADNNLHTLSSVIETPFIKFDDSNQAYDILNRKEELYVQSNVKDKILLDASKYFNMNDSDLVGKYLTLKSKLKNDVNDTREAFIIEEENFYSIVCGKISVIHSIASSLIEKIKSKQ